MAILWRRLGLREASSGVNRRPKRAHPHCPLNTLADKLFFGIAVGTFWTPIGVEPEPTNSREMASIPGA